MITEQTKAVAKARIKQGVPLGEIASELEIPLKLVEEWKSQETSRDLIVQEATVLAVDKIIAKEGELEPLLETKLRETLELTAIDLAKHAVLPAMNGDMVHAKAIQLLADAIVKLYQTIILKSGAPKNDAGGARSDTLDTFAEMMKD